MQNASTITLSPVFMDLLSFPIFAITSLSESINGNVIFQVIDFSEGYLRYYFRELNQT